MNRTRYGHRAAWFAACLLLASGAAADGRPTLRGDVVAEHDALTFGDLTTALNAEGGSSWWTILSTMTQSLVYLGLATWVARAMGLVTSGPPVGGALPPAGGDPVLAVPPPRL